MPRRDAAQKPFDQRQTSRVWHRLSTLSVTEQGSQTLFHEFNSSDILEDLSGKEYKTDNLFTSSINQFLAFGKKSSTTMTAIRWHLRKASMC